MTPNSLSEAVDPEALPAASLLVNLSMVGTKPTGIANYAVNLVPGLPLPLTLLAPAPLDREPLLRYPRYPVPANLTPEQGKLGHLRRLWWTQTQPPRLARTLRSRLFFSPVPEAPIGVGCRSVVMVHDLIPLRFPRWTSPLTHYFRHYVPQVLNQAEHILCNSAATAQDIVDYFQVSAAKITPILLAHDSDHFRVLDPQDCPPAPDRPYFLYLGRHDLYKNLHRLIRAFAILPDRHNYQLWFAGSPDPRYTPTLHQLAIELGVAEQVKFLDYVAYKDLPGLLNQAIALVFPSLWEGFGFPVLEAMACGAPVITSKRSSLPEVAGDAALLIDPASEAELTAAMQQVATDPQTRSQLRSAGLARAQQFSWTKTGQATAAVLRRYL